MVRGRFKLIALGLAAFSLLLSSCFTIRVIGVSPKVLGPGGTAKVVVKLFPVSTGTNGTTRPVLLIGLLDLDFGSVSLFDLKGYFGGPFARVSDAATRDMLLTPGQCTTSGVDASAVESSFDRWAAYRTVATVDSSANALNKAFKVTFLVDREAGTSSTSAGFYVVFSAAWGDDGDGVAESGEFICTGVMSGSVAFQP